MTDGRSTSRHSRKALPVGTVRIRIKNGAYRVRMIKVRDDGPKHRRWMAYARWWWLNNRGEIPHGMRVLHDDGDTLNDEPGNYVLGTAADAAAIWHYANPDKSNQAMAKCHAATAETNRLRSAITRQRSWLPTYWYAVDFQRREVFNQPRRKRWQVYADWGVKAPEGAQRDRMAIHAAALGWPQLPLLGACVMHVLLAHQQAMQLEKLAEQVNVMRLLRGWKAVEKRRLYHINRPLKDAGLIAVRRCGTSPGLVVATMAAAGLAGEVCPIVPVRGKRIMNESQFSGFGKISGDGLPRLSVAERRCDSHESGIVQLARLIAGGAA